MKAGAGIGKELGAKPGAKDQVGLPVDDVVTGFALWLLDAVWTAVPYIELIDIRTNAADEPHPAQGLKLQLEIGRIGGLEEVDARRGAEALPLALGAESYLTIIDPRLKADGGGAIDP